MNCQGIWYFLVIISQTESRQIIISWQFLPFPDGFGPLGIFCFPVVLAWPKYICKTIFVIRVLNGCDWFSSEMSQAHIRQPGCHGPCWVHPSLTWLVEGFIHSGLRRESLWSPASSVISTLIFRLHEPGCTKMDFIFVSQQPGSQQPSTCHQLGTTSRTGNQTRQYCMWGARPSHMQATNNGAQYLFLMSFSMVVQTSHPTSTYRFFLVLLCAAR